ncbi:SpaH/EbpB family LPXTG-anchored major pilin [Microbacterium invictum]|uniref:LPXTG-motif cell wall-anchored protein n=1 Tax=Microbacterium invictum TaxID=515415 RepID=A0AA40SPV5_9MICO|nr:SpaH/EbpB family LPXTG-anchored major pilin [Microbacterium invictum]MBB4140141.1 LPXTG-motif cell wall-anchored protein [Microbacterium invictum]
MTTHRRRPHPAATALPASLIRTPLAALVAVVLSVLAVLGGALPSQAASDPDAVVTMIEIHKFSQPHVLGALASGLPQDTSGLTPVSGATFTATRVPGIDPTTSAGQARAAALTAATATALTSGANAAARATTDRAGNATLGGLAVGVYLVTEVATPAGFVPAVPFVVVLPLTDPEAGDRWLSTVHVYPKNAQAGVVLEVSDRDAVTLGDVVGWVSRSGIPNLRDLDGYRVVQKIDPRLALVDAGTSATVVIDCGATTRALCPQLTEGTHYTRVYDANTRTLTVEFTAAGLELLARAVAGSADARVVVTYATTVLAEGEIRNEAVLYASSAAMQGGEGAPAPVSDTAMTKWGPLAIIVHERGKPETLIPGAVFRLYLSAEDARAGRNPIVVGGVSEWSTDAQGRIDIPGLRWSGFVDGLDREATDALYRYYYAMPVSFPAGYTGVKSPLQAVVDSATEAQVLVVELWRASTSSLPVTGGQLSMGLVLAGAGMVGAGIVFVTRRRRRSASDEGA